MSEYDEYFILCNFGGRIMSGFKVLDESLQRPSPLVAWGKKKTVWIGWEGKNSPY